MLTWLRCTGLLCLLGWRACLAAVSPADGTDAVLALHAKSGGELQLRFTRAVADQDPQSILVGIGSDYFYTRDARSQLVYDFSQRRIYTVGSGGRFLNNSMFAEVWIRVTELENRVRLRKAALSSSLPSGSVASEQEPFWMETQMGIISPDLPRPPLERHESDGRIHWTLGHAEVAVVRYVEEPVPDAVRGGLRRFWSTVVHLHPAITEDIAASGQIPRQLWFLSQPAAVDEQPIVTHWTLTARHWEPEAPFPLPPHLDALPARTAGAYPQIFALLSGEVAQNAKPPAQDAYLARVHAAIDHRSGLEAAVDLIEMNLAVGQAQTQCREGDPREVCVLAAKTARLVKSDPLYAIAFAANSPDATQRPKFDGLRESPVLRLLWATKPPGNGVGRDDTERDVLAALTYSPVANFTKGAGDFYIVGRDPFAAWQVWDLGRQMAGHRRGDLLQTVDSLEDELYVGAGSLF